MQDNIKIDGKLFSQINKLYFQSLKRHDSPLMAATKKGQFEMVEKLLSEGIDANTADDYKNSVLQEAAIRGHKDIVLLLINNGADVNAKNKSGISIIGAVAEKGCLECFKILHEKGAKIHDNENSRNVFQIAAECGHVEILKYLLEQKLFSITDKSASGWTALHSASRYGHTNAVKFILKNGAQINELTDDNSTSLHLAIRHKEVETAIFLISKGANLNIRENNDKTILHLAAAKRGGAAVINELLSRGVDVDSLDYRSMTPLMVAARERNIEAIESLGKHHARVNLRNRMGETALIRAVIYGNADTVKAILKFNPDPNIIDGWRHDALWYAKDRSKEEIVTLLKDYTIEYNKPNWRTRVSNNNFRELGA
jgi:cytohesin